MFCECLGEREDYDAYLTLLISVVEQLYWFIVTIWAKFLNMTIDKGDLVLDYKGIVILKSDLDMLYHNNIYMTRFCLCPVTEIFLQDFGAILCVLCAY
jgi:hypothetical protein